MPVQQLNFVSSRHYVEVAEQFTSIGFWNADMTTGEVRATQGFFKLIGSASPGAISLVEWISLVHPEDQDDFRSMFSIVDMGVPVSREIRLAPCEHATRWIRVAIAGVKRDAGPSGLMIGMVQDITAERESRAALYRERARLGALVALTGETFWATNLNGTVMDLRGWQALTGQSQREASNGGWIEAIHAEDRERVVDEWTACFHAATPYAASFRLRYVDGEYRPVTVRGMPVTSEAGRAVEWIGTIRETWREDAAEALPEGEAALQPQQVRAARAMLGWSVERLACEAGISVATIRRYEAGEGHLKERTIAAIIAALAEHGVVMTASATGTGLRLLSNRQGR